MPNLSKLIEAALAGEEVVIAKGKQTPRQARADQARRVQDRPPRRPTFKQRAGFLRTSRRNRSHALGRRQVRGLLIDTHAWAWSLTGDGARATLPGSRLRPFTPTSVETGEIVQDIRNCEPKGLCTWFVHGRLPPSARLLLKSA